jgi:hypothetical protein
MDRTLFLLMLRCGLRVSEVVQLKVSDIDWPQQDLSIEQGKGRKDRRVYVSADAVTSLRECVQRRPSEVPGDGGVLESETAQPPTVGQGDPEKDGTLCQSVESESQAGVCPDREESSPAQQGLSGRLYEAPSIILYYENVFLSYHRTLEAFFEVRGGIADGRSAAPGRKPEAT